MSPVDREKDNVHNLISHIDKINHLDKSVLYLSIKWDSPDKAKPSVRRGRKAAALLNKMAELPKNESFVALLCIQFTLKRVLIKSKGGTVMKTCRFAITFISLFVFVIIAAFTMAGQAKADAIVIDPGPPRPAPYEIDIPFNELNGTAVSGQSLSQDFIFADKEWIYVSSETHGVLLMLQTDYTGGMLLTCLPGTGFLLGESYAPLSVPMALNFPGPSNDGGRLIAALYTGDLMGQTIQLDTPFT